MQAPWERESPRSAFGLVSSALAGACVVAGAVSLADAADGWQDFLNTLASFRRVPGCNGPFVVPGWGDGAVLVCTIAAIALFVLTGWATLRLSSWGRLTAVFAVVPILIMWLDTYAVSGAPGGNDCDAIGLRGAASVAITRAGWLFFAAALLCAVASIWLASRPRDPHSLPTR